jgi:hypothetical protein
MKKYLYAILMIGIAAAGAACLSSCKDDDEAAAPTLTLSEELITASPGQQISVSIEALTAAGFDNLVVTKLWDGVSQNEETFETLPDKYTYTVTEQDADHVLTINFTVKDTKGRTASKDVVVTIELTPRQLLLKYNWRLNEEIRKKTNANDIDDVYNDDVYQFNADGTYQKSIGQKKDDFNDIWYNYCYWDLNDNSLKLLMSRTGAFGEKVTDTLNITLIDETKLQADVTYYDLDVFDATYDKVEQYQKRFVAVPKTPSFDPYLPGADDDATGPAGYCEDVVFEND